MPKKPQWRDRHQEPILVRYHGISFTPAVRRTADGRIEPIWSPLHGQWMYAVPGGGIGTAPQCREVAEYMARRSNGGNNAH